MNKTSLSQIIVNNQYNHGLGAGLISGAKEMRRELRQDLERFLMDMVSQYAKYDYDLFLTLDMLPSDEQDELLRLHIEILDRDIEGAALGDESMNSDFNCAMIKMLACNNKENREALAEIVRKNLIEYFRDPLNKILEEACYDYTNAMESESYNQMDRDADYCEMY